MSKDGFLSYEGVKYGVPWIYSGQELSVREVKEEIEITVSTRLFCLAITRIKCPLTVSYCVQE